ncbi:MAG: enoyl-CoA hydratase-related protein [Acidobacteriota bacterium]
MSSEAVLLRRDGSIATVVLDRPEKLNALDLGAWQLLGEVVARLGNDDGVRCIVLRGADERAFAAGADISEFARQRSNVEQARRYGEVVDTTMEAIAGCRHPTVAMIQGACVGGGLEIACACDLRICSRSSRFGVPVNRLGLTMAYGELRCLLAVVGAAAAREILLEGAIFGADRALQIGLVTRVVEDELVEEETYATVRRIAEAAPLVHRWHKKFIRRLGNPEPLSREEIEEGYAAFGSADFRTGYRAFLDKTKPEFEGK